MLWDSRWTFSISRDSAECLFPRICLVALWDSIEPTLRKFSSLNREILKPILPTTARKPASIQEHESYFCSLWDDSDLLLNLRSRKMVFILIQTARKCTA